MRHRPAPLARCMALVILLFASAVTQARENVRIGVLAWQGLEEAEVHWASLAHQLEEHLPGKHIELTHTDLVGMAAALRARQLDFVVTNPGHYVMLESETGISRIATQVGAGFDDPAHVVGSALVVKGGRQDIRTLVDLRGKRVAAVSPDAFGGYQVIWAELRRAGLDPESGQVALQFTDFPMSRVIDAVRKGDADAGVLRACLLERLEREGVLRPGELQIVAAQSTSSSCQISSPLYPGWAFAAAANTPPALAREVLLALLSLAPDVNGSSWSVPADYHTVYALFRELQIGPYAILRETAWSSLARRYWPWLAGLLVVLLAGGAYTLRVEHLVKRRTRELTHALNERHRLEATVHAGQQQMEHLSRLSILGELSGTLAHELNQPLATIGNYARSLLRRQQRGQLSPQALQQAAEEIANESERAAGILGSIRAFARKRARVREVCDMAALVSEAVELMLGMAANGPRIILQDGLSTQGRHVCVDPMQIQQVLLNLFKNAWDAQQAMGVVAPIEVTLQVVDASCRIAVRDHGIGLAPEVGEHLFEAFFTTKPQGLGLGLSICKTIIEAHGGEMQAMPADPGAGAVFWFSLPLVAEAAAASGDQK
jgi:two-component system, LuxR family, sensor histidine kinase TtrS